MSLFRALRSITRPLPFARSLNPQLSLLNKSSAPSSRPSFSIGSHPYLTGFQRSSIFERFCSNSTLLSADFSRLTETRFPKRRPGMKNRKKRASLKPPGPYRWVQYVPGEPIPRCRPNEGGIKARGRKEKKRMRQRNEFILSERKKKKEQYAESRKKKEAERIERKMAQVAREKEWAQRLIELQQLEQAKNNNASAA